MNKIKPKKNNFQGLRKKAEGKLNFRGKKYVKQASPVIEHELNIHKIELEMQNEELLSIQAKLVKSNEEYTELFDYAPIGYFILDKNGIITNVNRTGCKQLGIDKNKLTGKHFSVFLNSKSCQDDFYRQSNLAIESEQKQQIECEVKKSDGSVFFALIECILVKDKNYAFKHLFSTVSDISRQKEQERMLESALGKEKEVNEMKSQFITIASHEFRTPLATIMTSAELIEKYKSPKDNEKSEKHFRKIKGSVNRLKEILMDFLSVNDIEKGKTKYNPETFDLVKFTEDVIEEVGSFNGTHTVKYKHNNQLQVIYSDKKLLKTCLTNLMINAFKYSPNGGTVEITTKQNLSGSASISVKDEGIGIPENDRPHIFEQFYRAKNSNNIQGTGLGLNITQQLTVLMGGTISFTSKENEGTTFVIKLPGKL